jgi:hypothetical protein
VPDLGEVSEVMQRLIDACKPYIDNAAPHEQLFSGEDQRNFDKLASARADAMRCIAALKRSGDLHIKRKYEVGDRVIVGQDLTNKTNIVAEVMLIENNMLVFKVLT